MGLVTWVPSFSKYQHYLSTGIELLHSIVDATDVGKLASKRKVLSFGDAYS